MKNLIKLNDGTLINPHAIGSVLNNTLIKSEHQVRTTKVLSVHGAEIYKVETQVSIKNSEEISIAKSSHEHLLKAIEEAFTD